MRLNKISMIADVIIALFIIACAIYNQPQWILVNIYVMLMRIAWRVYDK